MNFLIVINAGLNTEDFFDKNNFLLDCAKDFNIKLTIMKNTDIMFSYTKDGTIVNLPKFDAVLFYSKDIFLAKALEENGYKVFNSSECISNCDNKAITYKILSNHNLPIPKTYLLPLTFYYDEKLLFEFLNNLEKELSYPFIAKKWYGSEGKQVFLIKSRNDLNELIKQEQGKELLFQKYYSECHGKDIRINIVGNKVISAMKRTSLTGDFRSNTSIGGKAENYFPTEEEKKIAITASHILGCIYSGIDILQTNNGPVICEVNSNAQLKNIYRLTKQNAFSSILSHIINILNEKDK